MSVSVVWAPVASPVASPPPSLLLLLCVVDFHLLLRRCRVKKDIEGGGQEEFVLPVVWLFVTVGCVRCMIFSCFFLSLLSVNAHSRSHKKLFYFVPVVECFWTFDKPCLAVLLLCIFCMRVREFSRRRSLYHVPFFCTPSPPTSAPFHTRIWISMI